MHSTTRFLLLAGLLFFFACSSTSPFTTVSHDRSKGSGFENILVIALAANEPYERLAEEAMVDRLKQAGVNAVPWIDFPGGNRRVSESSVMKAIKGTQIDAVLVSRVQSIRTQDRLEPEQANIGWSIGSMADSPANWSRDQNVTIDVLVSLFNTEAGLVWRGKSSSENPRSTEYLIEKSASAAVTEIRALDLVR